MTAHFGDQNPFGLGLSDAGQMGTGPDEAERTLLGRVLNGLRNLGTASSDEEERVA